MVTTPIDRQGEYKAICLWKVKGRDLQKDVNDFSLYTIVGRKEGELSDFAGRSMEAEIEKQMLFQ